MLGYVLRYLAARAAGASRPEARSRVPWLVRGLAVRKAKKFVIAAGFDTGHPEDEAHVARLAYLRAAAKPVHVDDIAVVAKAFQQGRDEARERRAWVGPSVAVILSVVIAGGAAGGWAWWRASEAAPLPEADPAQSTPSLEALLGMEDDEPEHALYDVFRNRIPEYTVALDSRSGGAERIAPGDVVTTREQVLNGLAERGPDLVGPMTELLDAAEHYVAATGEDDDQGLWLNSLVGFHDALDAMDAPFFVDAVLRRNRRSGRQRVLLSTYRVPARRTFVVGDQRIRQFDLERLDRLNYERSLLGYTRPEVRVALVRIDRIERFLVDKVLPSIHAANESVIVRGYEDETGIEWVTSFEEHAHTDLREEAEALVGQALGPTSTGLRDLSHAIVERRNGARDLDHALRRSGVRLRQPRGYVYDISQLSGLGDRADPAAVGRVRQAELSLREERVVGAYRVLANAFTLSIAEHEVQHRLDYQAGRLVEVPMVLSQYTGETRSEDRVNRRAERANAELSAYLSQVAQRPSMSRTSLIHVASFVMARSAWGMPEAYAAVALFEALAATLDFDHAPLIRNRRIDRGEIARIYAEVRQLGGAGLSELAGRTWTRIYGAPIADIELVD